MVQNNVEVAVPSLPLAKFRCTATATDPKCSWTCGLGGGEGDGGDGVVEAHRGMFQAAIGKHGGKQQDEGGHHTSHLNAAIGMGFGARERASSPPKHVPSWVALLPGFDLSFHLERLREHAEVELALERRGAGLVQIYDA